MDGILNILKPPGVTSFDIVAQIRRLLKIKKVGHTGTLDPDAVGVLPICLGRATRMVEYLMNDHKFYRGEVTLGIVTDTQDSQGVVTARYAVDKISTTEIERVIAGYLGKIEQIPPMVSAVKYKGKRLYELARQGKEIEREPRTVEIHSIRILRVDLPRFWIDVECSKGTYVRTLAHDIGQSLGCGAHLSYLIRTGTGEFGLNESITLAEVEAHVKSGRISEILLPIDWGIRSMPKSLLRDEALNKAVNGVRLQNGDYQEYPANLNQGQLVRLYHHTRFISISQVVDPDSQILQPVKVFA